MEASLPRGEQSRTAILQAAHDLFVEQGYHGTSMRQIARQAGIALGGLYNHFKSKDAVFEAVFYAFHPIHAVLPYIQQAQGDNIEDLIRDATTRMVAVVRDRPDFLNLMFIEQVEFHSTHVQNLVNTFYTDGLQILQRVTQTDPEKLRPISAPMLVRSFLGLFFAYFFTEAIFATASPAEFRENAMQHFVDIYLHGILISPNPAPLPQAMQAQNQAG
jgi:AcrR family transcriptional regulator